MKTKTKLISQFRGENLHNFLHKTKKNVCSYLLMLDKIWFRISQGLKMKSGPVNVLLVTNEYFYDI